MEENKCCESGNCGKCKGQKGGMCCGHGYHGRCHMLKIVVLIFLIIVIFCLGAMFGRNNDFRGRDVYQRFMMNNGYGLKGNFNNSATGSTTVKVLSDTTTPATQ